jgi:SAM-dependent methyltransferase
MSIIRNYVAREIDSSVEKSLEKRTRTLFRHVIYEPFGGSSDHYGVFPEVPSAHLCELGMPIPPQKVMRRYAAAPEIYLNAGKTQTQAMIDIVRGAGLDLNSSSRILDFGCGAARMTRWLRLLGDGPEYWGVDVLGPDTFWARRALGEWLNIVTTTRLPHLPFEDRYFDLVYAGSVFSHIDDLAEAWLLELRRIVRPGGVLYLTVMDDTTVQILSTTRRDHLEKDVLLGNAEHIKIFDDYAARGASTFVIRRSPIHTLKSASPQVFYQAEFLKKHWGRWFDVVDYKLRAYGYQSAIVLKKRNS